MIVVLQQRSLGMRCVFPSSADNMLWYNTTCRHFLESHLCSLLPLQEELTPKPFLPATVLVGFLLI